MKSYEIINELKCWQGYHRVKGRPAGSPGSCAKNTNEQTSTPTVAGMSQSTAPSGDITTRKDVGGTSLSQTKTPGGFVKQTTASMDMGGAGTANMVKQAPQQPGQLAGTTTVTRTAAAGPKYDADAGIFGNAPATQQASGSAVQGVGFAGAGKDVTAATPKVVTTGDQEMAQQAQKIMNPTVQEEGDETKTDQQKPETKEAPSMRGLMDVILGLGRAATSMQGRDLGADLKQDVKTMIRNKVTGEPNR